MKEKLTGIVHFLHGDYLVKQGLLGENKSVFPGAGWPCGQAVAVHQLDSLRLGEIVGFTGTVLLVNPKRLTLFVRDDKMLVVFPVRSTLLHKLGLLDKLLIKQTLYQSEAVS